MTLSEKRRTPIWLAIGAAVLAAAVLGTLVLTAGGDEPAADGGYDLSSPERAARSFADAAAAGDEDGLLGLTCVAHPECVTQQGQVSPDEVEDAKAVLRDGMGRLAGELGDAEFGQVSEASLPGAVEVGYTTPASPDGLRQALIFVELDGVWLYVGSVGAAT